MNPGQASATHRPLAAALWMGGSVLGFCLVAISGRALRTHLDTFEVMLYRSLVGVVAVTAAAALAGRLGEIGTRSLGLHLVRNTVHFAGQNLWLFALSLIPLAQLFALEFSYPIMVALSAPLLLGERLSGGRLLSAAAGFAGILIVARPLAPGGLSPGLLAAMACAVGFAGAAILTKRLTRTVSVLCILFWLTLMQTLMGLACAALDGRVALPSAAALPWVLAIGLAGLVAHFSLTKALSLAPASLVVPVDFLRLPMIALVGAAFYGEPLDAWVLVGGAVILGANWLNLAADARRRPAV
ncbi:MAG: DMT family transporter [Proteobacteria bacterium]|nr:DMT family transporter [Pseudomonadota bacterium]MBS0573653.1 DMT family transporter [Pseudomonadota bacterium]